MHGIFLEIVVIQVMYIHAHVLFMYSKIELNRQKGEQIQTTLLFTWYCGRWAGIGLI